MAFTRTGYANFAAFPATGSANVIYVDLSNGNEYLWSTSAYVAYTGTLAGVRTGYQDAAWFAANPTFLLGKGQRVDLLQTGTYKLGDGVTTLSGLSFLGGAAATPTIQQVLTAGQVATITIETTGFIKTGGASSEFLKADGSVDTTVYITSAALAPYLTIASAAATYQPIGSYLTTISGIAAGGELAGTYANPTLLNSAVIGKLLTGYVSGAGTVAATDTILQAIQKLNGNIAAIPTGLTVGATTIASGTNTRILYNNSGVLGEYTVTGSGTTAVLSTSPTFTNTAASVNGITISNTINNANVYSGVIFVADAISSGQSVIGVTASSNSYVGASKSMWYSQKGIRFFADGAIPIDFCINGVNTPRFEILSTGKANFNAQAQSNSLGVNSTILKSTGSTSTWATGTVALQYFNWFSSNTTAAVGASNFTVVANGVFDYVQGGTNATNVTSAAIYVPTLALSNTTTGIGGYFVAPSGATTNWSLGTSGNVFHENLGSGTATISMQGLVGTLSQAAVYIGVSRGSETSSNYAFNWDGSLGINAQATTSALDFRQGSQSRMTIYGASTSGTNPRWLINFPQQTGLTASTESNDFLINSKTQTYAAGAQTLLRGLYYKSQSIAFASGSNAVTTYYTAYFESGTAGANCSGITNNYSLGTAGKAKFGGNVELTQTVTTEALVSDTSVTVVINGTTYKLLARA